MTPTPSTLPLVFHPDYEMNLGDHVFRTEKYQGAFQILREAGFAPRDAVHQPEIATRNELELVHTKEYLNDFENLQWSLRTMYSEVPLTQEIVHGFKLMAGGTVLACRLALTDGLAMHLGGGFHHAFADHAEGFCYINDIAVGIRVMQKEGRIRRAAVIDVDLHQGNGTAHIFEHDPEVFTFSIHQEWLYPEKQRSTIDVGLSSFIGNEVYLEELAKIVPSKIAEHDPELVVYVAGADPYEHDQLGDLQVTMEGMKERDRLVAEACRKNSWPMVSVLAGGYAHDKRDTARIHANTAIEMAKAWDIKPKI